MNTPFAAATLAAITASAAFAGGIDRSGQSVAPLFEDGRHLEFSFGSVNPNVTGTSVAGLGSANSGDMAATYSLLGAAYKADLSDTLSYAVIFDQPFGANVAYPSASGVPYYAAGSTAELKSTAATAVFRYMVSDNFSIIGGARAQSMEAEIMLPGANYTAQGDRNWAAGYVVGAAWEKPEIAARVAVYYNSAVKNQLATTETVGATTFPSSTTDITTPESINIDFQTGIATDTLLFGSVRWVKWDGFAISPQIYSAAPDALNNPNGPIVSFSNNKTAYSLGIGRRLSDKLAASISMGYEGASGGISSNLAPTDGYTSVGVGVSYTEGKVKISGGARYIWIGDAQTKVTLGSPPLGAPATVSPAANFTDNSGVAVGVKVAISLD